MKLSIIMPTFNEEKTIAEIVEAVKKQKVLGFTKEIIIVDDGSTDNTENILKKIKGVKTLRHTKNLGKGRAIRTGLQESSGEIILIQDADFELSPSDYPALLRPFLTGNAKVVYGSRNLGSHYNHSFRYYMGGRLVTFIANLLYDTNISDEPNGFKLFTSDLIKSLDLKCERFEFCPEVTAKVAKMGIKIYEVPVNYIPRTIKEGKKLRTVDGIQAVWTLIKYKFKK